MILATILPTTAARKRPFWLPILGALLFLALLTFLNLGRWLVREDPLQKSAALAVLSGRMREIKSRYERNHIVIEFEGSADFLKSDEIAEANNYSGHAEITLKPHGDAQKLLHQAASMAAIYRFELVEPSLEEIFIQTVGGKADA